MGIGVSFSGCSNITINGGEVEAIGGSFGSGIGGELSGWVWDNDDLIACQNITINGGIVNAYGSHNAAGIGSSDTFGNPSRNILISGGTVTACCRGTGAGIGGNECDVTIINKDTVVIAIGGDVKTLGGASADNIGNGADERPSTVYVDKILTSEGYTSDIVIDGVLIKNVDGTIVHYTGKAPVTPNPDGSYIPVDSSVPSDPTTPDIPTIPDSPDNSSNPDGSENAKSKFIYTDELVLQLGARSRDSVKFTFDYDSSGIGELSSNLDCTAKGLGLSSLSLKTQELANFSIGRLDHALNKVSMIRATFGAAQNRIEHTLSNLTVSGENLTSAESTIRDTDMAEEMVNYTKYNILQQASQAILAQANQQPQWILQLLNG